MCSLTIFSLNDKSWTKRKLSWLTFRERQNQELEKQKEKDRIERDKQEREKLERDRQEKERELEKERQEQALHNHFEKSLRAAQQRVSSNHFNSNIMIFVFRFHDVTVFATLEVYWCKHNPENFNILKYISDLFDIQITHIILTEGATVESNCWKTTTVENF